MCIFKRNKSKIWELRWNEMRDTDSEDDDENSNHQAVVVENGYLMIESNDNSFDKIQMEDKRKKAWKQGDNSFGDDDVLERVVIKWFLKFYIWRENLTQWLQVLRMIWFL